MPEHLTRLCERLGDARTATTFLIFLVGFVILLTLILLKNFRDEAKRPVVIDVLQVLLSFCLLSTLLAGSLFAVPF